MASQVEVASVASGRVGTEAVGGVGEQPVASAMSSENVSSENDTGNARVETTRRVQLLHLWPTSSRR